MPGSGCYKVTLPPGHKSEFQSLEASLKKEVRENIPDERCHPFVKVMVEERSAATTGVTFSYTEVTVGDTDQMRNILHDSARFLFDYFKGRYSVLATTLAIPELRIEFTRPAEAA